MNSNCKDEKKIDEQCDEDNSTSLTATDNEVDPLKPLEKLLKDAILNDGLSRGLREAVRSIERGDAKLCILCESCDEPRYLSLIKALCTEHSVQIIYLKDNKKLGEMVGLSKLDAEGKNCKIKGCTCAVVTNLGDHAAYLNVLKTYSKPNSL